MAVSKRILQSMESSSWVRAMFETGRRLKQEHGADRVCDFSLGNPDLEPPTAFGEVLTKILADDLPHRHAYMPNGGYPDVRAAIAAYISQEYGITLTGDHVVMSCGAGGALNVVLKSILNPGDTVLAATPCFMEYRAYADNHGGTLKLVEGAPDFDLDVGRLAEAVDETTAAIIINSPNNPSGRVYPEGTLRSLGEMLERKSDEIGRSIYLVSDEPYRKIVYGNTRVPSVFRFYRNSIVASSYSKELSIPGERIGWVAVSPEADESATLVDAIILCTRILGYVNAPALMQRAVARLSGIQIDIEPYRIRRRLLCEGLKKIGYSFAEPEGTFYLFPEAPGGDDVRFVNDLQQELVLTVPGSGFGKPGYFRISFCVGEDVIHRSMDGFKRVFDAYTA